MTGCPRGEEGWRVQIVDSPLVALLFCLGGYLLEPRGLLQLAVLVAMVTFALLWGERGVGGAFRCWLRKCHMAGKSDMDWSLRCTRIHGVFSCL